MTSPPCPFTYTSCVYCGAPTWADVPEETPVCNDHQRMHTTAEAATA